MAKKKKLDLKAAAREKTQCLFDEVCKVALEKTNSIAGMQAVSLLEKWMDYDSEVNTKREPLRVQFVEIKALEDKSIVSLDPIPDPAEPVTKKKSRIDVIIYGTAQQAKFLNVRSRYKGCFAGRRWGKTYLFRNDAIKKTQEKPYSHYMYITPSYSQCLDEFKALCDNPAVAPLIFKADGSKPPNIVFKNGSKLSFRSFDRPNLIRGKAADWVWL